MTSDSKAHKRFPQIDDEMIARACRSAGVSPTGFGNAAFYRQILEAALDRRVGPKCRRVEWDDVGVHGLARGWSSKGRRSTDKNYFQDLPRKSSRLAREAAEKEEIEVSAEMRRAGRAAGHAIPALSHDWPTQIYTAMERVRREEQKGTKATNVHWRSTDRFCGTVHRRKSDEGGQEAAPQGAPYGASVPVRGTAYRIHERSSDAPRSPGSCIRMHRRADDPK